MSEIFQPGIDVLGAVPTFISRAFAMPVVYGIHGQIGRHALKVVDVVNVAQVIACAVGNGGVHFPVYNVFKTGPEGFVLQEIAVPELSCAHEGKEFADGLLRHGTVIAGIAWNLYHDIGKHGGTVGIEPKFSGIVLQRTMQLGLVSDGIENMPELLLFLTVEKVGFHLGLVQVFEHQATGLVARIGLVFHIVPAEEILLAGFVLLDLEEIENCGLADFDKVVKLFKKCSFRFIVDKIIDRDVDVAETGLCTCLSVNAQVVDELPKSEFLIVGVGLGNALDGPCEGFAVLRAVVMLEWAVADKRFLLFNGR